MKKATPILTILCVSIAMTGCQSKTLAGAAIGATTGAIAGKSTGNHKDKRLWIGAVVGALAGAAAGQYMDAQAEKLQTELADTGIEVEREDENIRLIMPSNVTFASNQSTLAVSSYKALNAIAEVMKEYDQTLLSVDGFTDSVGDPAYNQTLSTARAESVRNYLQNQGISAPRMIVQGMGAAKPIASNDTAEGRAQNRRVEIEIIPNKA